MDHPESLLVKLLLYPIIFAALGVYLALALQILVQGALFFRPSWNEKLLKGCGRILSAYQIVVMLLCAWALRIPGTGAHDSEAAILVTVMIATLCVLIGLVSSQVSRLVFGVMNDLRTIDHRIRHGSRASQ